MEQVNLLIVYLKQTKLLDGLLSVANDQSFIDHGTLKAIIKRGLDSSQAKMKQALSVFELASACDQLISLINNDEKVRLKNLKDLCGIAQMEGSESGFAHQMTFGGNEKVVPTLKVELRDYLVKLGFDMWIQGKKNFIMIKLKSKKD
jgi:hypothetical protein